MTIPPGLTCAVCQQPFARALARRTPAGYQHAAPCPEVESPPALTDGQWVNRGGVRRWEAAA